MLKSMLVSEIEELGSRHLGRTENMGVRTLSNRLLSNQRSAKLGNRGEEPEKKSSEKLRGYRE